MSSKVRNRRIALAAVAAVAGGLFLTAGTGCDAFTEEWNDAKVEHKYDHPAEVYSMPDGFANFASKCDVHGNRVYTTRWGGDGQGKAITVVPNDPSCNKWKLNR
jgi:hypothetical protein